MNHLMTVAEAVATHARLRPNDLATRDSRRSLTWAEWDERVNRLANGLIALGLKQGDRVALLAYNCVEWMEMYAGLARAGLVAVPVNFRLMAPEIAYIATHCEAQAFIAQGELCDRVEGIRSELGIDAQRFISFHTEPRDGWTAYEDLMQAASPAAPGVQVSPDDAFAFMYTSGTTGRPKGAIRNHGGHMLLGMATALDMGFKPEHTALLVMPMCHANSVNFMMTFVYRGGVCVIDDARSFDPERLLAKLASEKVSFTSLVPTHYIMMLALPESVKAKYDVSSVEKLMISSAPARKETKLAIMAHFKNSGLYELYGSTEAGWVTILHPHEQLERLGSVGREWAGSGPIRILDPDGKEVADGETGELFSRTSYVFDGYWKNPEKTAEAFQGQWCSVGDMARRDADGYIWLVDRKSNMIISGGENVYPSEIEGVLAGHPKVRDVAVIGLPHDKWGEAVTAVLVLHEGQSATEEEIGAWCRERMAGYKRPRQVLFLDEKDMPRTATGKIQHRILRERIVAQMEKQPA